MTGGRKPTPLVDAAVRRWFGWLTSGESRKTMATLYIGAFVVLFAPGNAALGGSFLLAVLASIILILRAIAESQREGGRRQ